MNDVTLKPPITNVAQHHETDHKNIQEVLTVRQIMTPRSKFLCCSTTSRIGEAFYGVPDVYDAIPVVDGPAGDDSAELVGVIWRREVQGNKPLARVEEILDERPVDRPLPATTPMLEYARSASADRVSLVCNGTEIVGLVTVYDLERLPVRLSLFQHLLYFEQRLGQVIEAIAPDEDTWAGFAPSKREEIKAGIRRSRSRDHLGSPILGIGFTEKVAIARKMLPAAFGPVFKTGLLDHVAPFRNEVAHGLPFAKVEDVPERIRQIDRLLDQISPDRIRAFI